MHVRNEKQKKKILEILKKCNIDCYFPNNEKGEEQLDCVHIEGEITFEAMQHVVDYLHRENENIQFPPSCRLSTNPQGDIIADLYNTPHNEVMKFCEQLAWVRGHDFGFWYNQYVTCGKICI